MCSMKGKQCLYLRNWIYSIRNLSKLHLDCCESDCKHNFASLRCYFQHSLTHKVAVTFIHLLVWYFHVMSMSVNLKCNNICNHNSAPNERHSFGTMKILWSFQGLTFLKSNTGVLSLAIGLYVILMSFSGTGLG